MDGEWGPRVGGSQDPLPSWTPEPARPPHESWTLPREHALPLPFTLIPSPPGRAAAASPGPRPRPLPLPSPRPALDPLGPSRAPARLGPPRALPRPAPRGPLRSPGVPPTLHLLRSPALLPLGPSRALSTGAVPRARLAGVLGAQSGPPGRSPCRAPGDLVSPGMGPERGGELAQHIKMEVFSVLCTT